MINPRICLYAFGQPKRGICQSVLLPARRMLLVALKTHAFYRYSSFPRSHHNIGVLGGSAIEGWLREAHAWHLRFGLSSFEDPLTVDFRSPATHSVHFDLELLATGCAIVSPGLSVQSTMCPQLRKIQPTAPTRQNDLYSKNSHSSESVTEKSFATK